MAQKEYRATCRLCGKASGSKVWGQGSGAAPTQSPVMPGKCPSSPSGKHAPKWVRA